jgi:diaminohydroxyphosphoribosylaminopyrimidine deaminase/5-amino-6-(5-phosphoribosylamino)uracil reductase
LSEIERDDRKWMRRAIALAARGLNACAPNPLVGCVIVRDGRAVGEGWHARVGEPHAEVHALREAGAAAAGATAYVSLEPCCHHGRTPPCTDALIAARVSRVVAAMGDPDPRVGGGGFAILRRAGIEVTEGILEEQAHALNSGFVSRVTRGRPYVRCKIAASLDGATAMASGESRWITGEAARRDVQRLRSRSSAILTGAGTALHDDPRLNVRLPAGGWTPPLRVVLDTDLKLPPEARMLREAGETLVFTASDDVLRTAELRAVGARVEHIARSGQRLDLRAALERLGALGVNDVLVEAGATLNGALIEAGLVDEIVVYLAPRILGRSTRGMFELPGLTRLEDGTTLELLEVRRVGSDLRIRARPKR